MQKYSIFLANIGKNMYLCTMQVGILLCIHGTAEKILNGYRLTMQRGTVHIISPIITCVDLSQSADFCSLSLTEMPDQIMDVTFPFLTHLAERNVPLLPVLWLSEEQCAYYEHSISQIQRQQQEITTMETSSILRQAQEKLILLRKQTVLLELFTHLMSDTERGVIKSITYKEQVVMRFLQSMAKQHASHRQVAFYAAQAGLSQRYFSAIVSERLSMTPMQIITLVTINDAKRLLREKGVLVKQVAEQLGFPEQFTFRKYFKTHTGISPRAYQQSVQ